MDLRNFHKASGNALYEAPNVDNAVNQMFGMQPNMDRLNLLPRYDQRLGWVAPNALYQLARAFVSPSVAANGGGVSEADAMNFGGNLVGAGLGASAISPTRGRVMGMGVPQTPKPTNDVVRSTLKQIEQKHGLFTLDGWLRDGDLHISMIEVPKGARKQGIGTAAMNDIAQYADDNGLRVTLSPDVRNAERGTTSRGRLVDFYKRFGFVENKGQKKDFALSEGMYREPGNK